MWSCHGASGPGFQCRIADSKDDRHNKTIPLCNLNIIVDALNDFLYI